MLKSAPSAVLAPDPQIDRRRVPRIPFKATSVVTGQGSAQTVFAQTSELSRFGCFVKTTTPLPEGSRIEIHIADGGDVFMATAKVAYVTGDGMGVVFSLVEPESYEILAKWLDRTPRQFDRYNFHAGAEVKELGRWGQRLITRDLSAGGCFIRTATPLSTGTRVGVRIEHKGGEVTATGRVTHIVPLEGMGIEFTEISSKDRELLAQWLADQKQKP